VSPVINDELGDVASFAIAAGFAFAGLVYLILFVKEPLEPVIDTNQM